MKSVGVFCGGESYEHEVSIITGIQVAETMDLSQYNPMLVYFDKSNNPFLIKNFRKREDFKTQRKIPISFEKSDSKVYVRERGLFGKKYLLEIVYLGFHGGTGESGGIQGMLEVLGVPFTSPGSEGSVIAMNKVLTKQVLRDSGLPVLDSYSVQAGAYKNSSQPILSEIKSTFSFPVIIKPVHLGSSIAIEVAHNEAELEKFLNVAVRIDSEILIEPALTDFTEYNVSVRSHNGMVELSPIEEPKRESEILTFEDKYTKGGKKGLKNGGKIAGKSGGGMEMLDRTVPADITTELAEKINLLAKAAYQATRLEGLVRIDFMYHAGKLYCTEINPIPGSMSFYLWEPAGEQFSEQITISLTDAEERFANRTAIVPYETDIVEKYIGN